MQGYDIAAQFTNSARNAGSNSSMPAMASRPVAWDFLTQTNLGAWTQGRPLDQLTLSQVGQGSDPDVVWAVGKNIQPGEVLWQVIPKLSERSEIQQRARFSMEPAVTYESTIQRVYSTWEVNAYLRELQEGMPSRWYTVEQLFDEIPLDFFGIVSNCELVDCTFSPALQSLDGPLYPSDRVYRVHLRKNGVVEHVKNVFESHFEAGARMLVYVTRAPVPPPGLIFHEPATLAHAEYTGDASPYSVKRQDWIYQFIKAASAISDPVAGHPMQILDSKSGFMDTCVITLGVALTESDCIDLNKPPPLDEDGQHAHFSTADLGIRHNRACDAARIVHAPTFRMLIHTRARELSFHCNVNPSDYEAYIASLKEDVSYDPYISMYSGRSLYDAPTTPVETSEKRDGTAGVGEGSADAMDVDEVEQNSHTLQALVKRQAKLQTESQTRPDGIFAQFAKDDIDSISVQQVSILARTITSVLDTMDRDMLALRAVGSIFDKEEEMLKRVQGLGSSVAATTRSKFQASEAALEQITARLKAHVAAMVQRLQFAIDSETSSLENAVEAAWQRAVDLYTRERLGSNNNPIPYETFQASYSELYAWLKSTRSSVETTRPVNAVTDDRQQKTAAFLQLGSEIMEQHVRLSSDITELCQAITWPVASAELALVLELERHIKDLESAASRFASLEMELRKTLPSNHAGWNSIKLAIEQARHPIAWIKEDMQNMFVIYQFSPEYETWWRTFEQASTTLARCRFLAKSDRELRVANVDLMESQLLSTDGERISMGIRDILLSYNDEEDTWVENRETIHRVVASTRFKLQITTLLNTSDRLQFMLFCRSKENLQRAAHYARMLRGAEDRKVSANLSTTSATSKQRLIEFLMEEIKRAMQKVQELGLPCIGKALSEMLTNLVGGANAIRAGISDADLLARWKDAQEQLEMMKAVYFQQTETSKRDV